MQGEREAPGLRLRVWPGSLVIKPIRGDPSARPSGRPARIALEIRVLTICKLKLQFVKKAGDILLA